MGFSSEAIVIKPEIKESQFDEFIKSLGYTQHVKKDTVYFEDANPAEGNDIYICNVKGVTYIIYNEIFIDNMYREDGELSSLEKKITNFNANCEIVSLMNFESSNSYGYTYVKNGKLLRSKLGDYNGVQDEYGDELSVEKAYYEKKEVINGEAVFYVKGYGDKIDKYTQDQIGGEVAFKLTEMLTGSGFMDDDFFHSEPIRYVKSESKGTEVPQEVNEQVKDKTATSENSEDNAVKLDSSYDTYIPKSDYAKLLTHYEQVLKPFGYKKLNSSVFLKQFQHINFQMRLDVIDEVQDVCRVKCIYKAITSNPIGSYMSNTVKAIRANKETEKWIKYDADAPEKIYIQIDQFINEIIMPYFVDIESRSIRTLKNTYCKTLRTQLNQINPQREELLQSAIQKFKDETKHEFWEDKRKEYVIDSIKQVFTETSVTESGDNAQNVPDKYWYTNIEALVVIGLIVAFLIIMSASNSY